MDSRHIRWVGGDEALTSPDPRPARQISVHRSSYCLSAIAAWLAGVVLRYVGTLPFDRGRCLAPVCDGSRLRSVRTLISQGVSCACVSCRTRPHTHTMASAMAIVAEWHAGLVLDLAYTFRIPCKL